VTDRRTNGQTGILRQHSPHYAYASCGKNWDQTAQVRSPSGVEIVTAHSITSSMTSSLISLYFIVCLWISEKVMFAYQHLIFNRLIYLVHAKSTGELIRFGDSSVRSLDSANCWAIRWVQTKNDFTFLADLWSQSEFRTQRKTNPKSERTHCATFSYNQAYYAYLVRPYLEVNPHDKAYGLADQSMKKHILVDLILFSLFLKQFRLGASTVSRSNLLHMSVTQFEKQYFLISVLNLGL